MTSHRAIGSGRADGGRDSHVSKGKLGGGTDSAAIISDDRDRGALVSYFDSAYIAKFYLDEPESEAVRRLAESLGQVRCAQIGHVEVAAVFLRKFREGTFDAGAFREVTAQFDDDCGDGL